VGRIANLLEGDKSTEREMATAVAPRISNPNGDLYLDDDDRDRHENFQAGDGGWTTVTLHARVSRQGQGATGQCAQECAPKRACWIIQFKIPIGFKSSDPRILGKAAKTVLRFTPGSVSSSWKDICTMGRSIGSACDLEFIEPARGIDGKLVASITKSEIKDNVNKWSNKLVGYVLGNKHFFTHLKACVGRTWKPACSLDVYSRGNDFTFSISVQEVNVIGSCMVVLGCLMGGSSF